MSEMRDQIRSKLFGQKPKSVVIPLEEGVSVEVRQPTVGALASLSEDIPGGSTGAGRLSLMLRNYCFVPSTNEKVFDEADVDSIASMPFGGHYSQLIKAIEALVDIDRTVEDQRKNLPETPGGKDS